MPKHPIFFVALLTLFLVSCGSAPEDVSGELALTIGGSTYDVMLDGHPVLSYNFASNRPDSLPDHYRRTGNLHPIYSPNGRVVTDGFPAGYAHQNGVFSAWAKTRFRDEPTDFWNVHKETGTVSHALTARLDTVGQHGRLTFSTTLFHHGLAEDTTLILREDQRVIVHDRRDVHMWELISEQRNITTDTLFLLQHLYGGLGVRGCKFWNPKDSVNFIAPTTFLTSQNDNRATGNHTRPAWTAIYGPVNPAGTEYAGLACIPDLENIRYPVPVRLHPDLPYFSVSPVVAGDTLIAPGETTTSRYLFVAFDGEPPLAILNGWAW